jgi:sugar transferase (PEP-CTERM system associated)
MHLHVLILLAGDILLAVLALFAAFLARFGSVPVAEDIFSLNGLMRVSVIVVVLIFISFLTEFYRLENAFNKRVLFIKIIISLILSFLALSSIYYLIPVFMFGRGVMAITLAFFGLFQYLWHVVFHKGRNLPGFANRVLVLGTGPLAHMIGGLVASCNNNHVLAGYYGCSGEPVTVPSQNILGKGSDLVTAANREKAHKIVVSLSERRGAFPMMDILLCKFSGIQVIDAPSFYEQMTGKLLIENITPSWFIFSNGFRITTFVRICKRAFDILLAATGIIVAIPLLPLIVVMIMIDSPGPVFFSQLRVGEREREFVLHKFRTMRADAESETGAVWSQQDDPRITMIGRFLRKSRLDEIPQLFNVLKGDMSFIGPRPERPEFVTKLKEVIPYYSERHFVKPGLTGWAQVRYPYGASVEDSAEKLRYDLYYIKNISLFLDLLIVLETAKVVMFGRGGR